MYSINFTENDKSVRACIMTEKTVIYLLMV